MWFCTAIYKTISCQQDFKELMSWTAFFIRLKSVLHINDAM